MGLKLYLIPASPPARAVILTAKNLDIDLELQEIDLLGGEHLRPKFIEMNPQHIVPTLVDDDYILWDSHAIIVYIITKYCNDDTDLYPKDPFKRGIVEQRLHFDCSILFPLVRRIVRNLYKGIETISEETLSEVDEAYGFLEAFLKNKEWSAGDFVSVADFSILATLTTLVYLVPLDEDKFPDIAAYMKKAESLPHYDSNLNGLKAFEEFVTNLRKP